MKTERVVLLAATVIILVIGLSAVELSRAQVDAHTRGYYDAIRDYHGKGYDPSCPSGHSAAFCTNYQSGYGAGWHVAQGANGVDMGSSNNGGSSGGANGVDMGSSNNGGSSSSNNGGSSSSNNGGSSSDNSGMGTSSSDNSGGSSLSETDRYNSGYNHGNMDAKNRAASYCSTSDHTYTYCQGYNAGYQAGQVQTQQIQSSSSSPPVTSSSDNSGGSSNNNNNNNNNPATSSSDNSGGSSSNNNNNNPSGSQLTCSQVSAALQARLSQCGGSGKLTEPTTCTIQTAYVIDTAGTDAPCRPKAVANVYKSSSSVLVNEGDKVQLDGSKSTDSGGKDRLLWHWGQSGGPTVDLSDWDYLSSHGLNPTFTAPKDIHDSTKLTFWLQVTDNLDVNDKAYHGNLVSKPAYVDVTICATKKDPSLNGIRWNDNQNVPNTQSGSCDYSKIDVRVRPIAGMSMGYGYAYHTWIVFTDENNKQYLFNGGPVHHWWRVTSISGLTGKYIMEPIGPDLGSLGVWSAGKEYTPANGGDDWRPDARSITILKGKENVNAQVKTCLEQQAKDIDLKGYEYAKTGPNSNTYVRTLLDNCGVWPSGGVQFGMELAIPGFSIRPFDLSKYPIALSPPPTVTPGPLRVGSIIYK